MVGYRDLLGLHPCPGRAPTPIGIHHRIDGNESVDRRMPFEDRRCRHAIVEFEAVDLSTRRVGPEGDGGMHGTVKSDTASIARNSVYPTDIQDPPTRRITVCFDRPIPEDALVLE